MADQEQTQSPVSDAKKLMEGQEVSPELQRKMDS